MRHVAAFALEERRVRCICGARKHGGTYIVWLCDGRGRREDHKVVGGSRHFGVVVLDG